MVPSFIYTEKGRQACIDRKARQVGARKTISLCKLPSLWYDCETWMMPLSLKRGDVKKDYSRRDENQVPCCVLYVSLVVRLFSQLSTSYSASSCQSIGSDGTRRMMTREEDLASFGLCFPHPSFFFVSLYFIFFCLVSSFPPVVVSFNKLFSHLLFRHRRVDKDASTTDGW